MFEVTAENDELSSESSSLMSTLLDELKVIPFAPTLTTCVTEEKPWESTAVQFVSADFTIAFNDSSFDESEYASFVSRYLGTDHYSEMFSSDKMVEILPRVWKMMDEPFSDPSLLPTFLLAVLTSNQLKVALSGDGGDEVFAGYPTYLAHKIDSFIPKFAYNIIRL